MAFEPSEHLRIQKRIMQNAAKRGAERKASYEMITRLGFWQTMQEKQKDIQVLLTHAYGGSDKTEYEKRQNGRIAEEAAAIIINKIIWRK
jgi:hypothetical protein